MKRKRLSDLEKMLDLKFQKKQSIFATVVAEEARLRGQIKKLDDQARAAEKSNGHHIRALGADMIWKTWVERTKTTLNMELAQVLAQKERLKTVVSKDYGRLLVSRELLANCKMEEARSRRSRALESSIEGHFQQKRAAVTRHEG